MNLNEVIGNPSLAQVNNPEYDSCQFFLYQHIATHKYSLKFYLPRVHTSSNPWSRNSNVVVTLALEQWNRSLPSRARWGKFAPPVYMYFVDLRRLQLLWRILWKRLQKYGPPGSLLFCPCMNAVRAVFVSSGLNPGPTGGITYPAWPGAPQGPPGGAGKCYWWEGGQEHPAKLWRKRMDIRISVFHLGPCPTWNHLASDAKCFPPKLLNCSFI